MTLTYTFAPEEINHIICLIGETYKRGSKPYATGKGKRLYEGCLGDMDKNAVDRMIGRCKRWYSSGIKKPISLNREEVMALKALYEYCKML